jgi:glycosyltransferase involved in cell wall biosynthesis
MPLPKPGAKIDTRYIRQARSGAGAARNQGIDAATGQFIAFLDADDYFAPEKLELQSALMLKAPAVLLSHTSYYRVNQTTERIGVVHSGEFCGDVYPDIVTNCPIATPTVMVRAECLRAGLRFNEKMRYGEDVILWASISRLGRILGIDVPLASVRVHGGNAFADPTAHIESRLALLSEVIEVDRTMGRLTKRRLTSRLLADIGLSYYRLGSWQSAHFFLRAFLQFPLSRRLPRQLVSMLLGRANVTAVHQRGDPSDFGQRQDE